MVKLKLQYFGHLMQKLIGKAPDAGKIAGRRKIGQQRMRLFDSITESMDMNLSTLQTVKDREARCAAVHGVTKSMVQLSDRTTNNNKAYTLLTVFLLWEIRNGKFKGFCKNVGLNISIFSNFGCSGSSSHQWSESGFIQPHSLDRRRDKLPALHDWSPCGDDPFPPEKILVQACFWDDFLDREISQDNISGHTVKRWPPNTTGQSA